MNLDGSPARPRVLHIVNYLESGGLERNLLALVQQTGDRFTHLVCCIRQRGSLAARFEASSVRVTALETSGRDLSAAWRLRRECRRLRPELVHTRNWGTIDGIVGARLAGVPAVVHSEHGRDAAILPPHRRWTLRALSPWLDAVVAVSEHLGRYLRKEVGIRGHKVSVIRNGVDSGRFKPVSDRKALRRSLDLEPEAPIVVAVGRLDPVKNYPGLVAAFELVRRNAPNARLVIVGDGPERARIEREVARRGLADVVRLAGYRDNVEAWLAAADVFTHSSLFEGMTNAALEAMATGLPVVATRVGGLPEIVAEGVTGRLVPCADEHALARAIVEYCVEAQVRLQHGEAGRRRVVSDFTPKAMANAYAALYERTLAGRRAPGLKRVRGAS